MNSLRKTLSLSIVVAVLLGITLLTGASTVVHANGLSQTSTNKVRNWQDVVAKANPYVHVVNNIATIDPHLTTYLSATEIALVRQSVAHYNNIPLTLRQHPHLSGSYTFTGGVHSNTIVGSYKSYRWTIDVYWWGVRMWINSPFAQNFGGVMAIVGGAIGGSIGNIVGAGAGAVIGAILGGVAGWLTAYYDNECGNRGAFIDVNWFIQVSANPVC